MSLQNFDIQNKLGEGAFSQVFRVRRKTDRQIYALKKIRFGNLKPKEQENAVNEIRILASLDHPNIVAYKEAFIDQDSACLWQILLSIIMELCDQGDLLQKINEHKRNGTYFQENEIWVIMTQIIQALKHLHDRKIMHRDLKCANVFISNNGVKLGDLNVSKVAKQGLVYTQTGTPYYASPEVWSGKPYDFKSDIWSLGCVIYETATLNPPFRAQNMEGLYHKVLRGVYPDLQSFYSNDLKNIISSLLQVNPVSRPSCDRLSDMYIIKRHVQDRSGDWQFQQNEDLLGTIVLPNNIKSLSNHLPGPNYEKKTQRQMTAQAKVLNPYLDHGSIRKSPVRAPLKRIPELSAERKRPSDSIDKGTPKNIVPSQRSTPKNYEPTRRNQPQIYDPTQRNNYQPTQRNPTRNYEPTQRNTPKPLRREYKPSPMPINRQGSHRITPKPFDRQAYTRESRRKPEREYLSKGTPKPAERNVYSRGTPGQLHRDYSKDSINSSVSRQCEPPKLQSNRSGNPHFLRNQHPRSPHRAPQVLHSKLYPNPSNPTLARNMSYDQKPFPESPKIGYIDPITPLNRIYSKGSLGSPNGGLVLRSPVYRGISGNNGKLNTDLYRNVKQEYERVHPSARREEINYIPKMPTPSRVRRY